MHGSRRLLLLFALTILLPGVILAGVGIRTLLQEGRSVEQEWRQRRDRVALQASQTLQRDIDSWLADIARGRAFAPFDPSQLPDPLRRALATPGAAAVVWGASPDDAWPPPAYRQWDARPSVLPAAFRAAEDLELNGGDLANAIAQYRALLTAAKGSDRAWLLHRVARSQRKAGNRDAASRALDDLGQMSDAFVQGLPADFLARYERCAPPNDLPCEASGVLQLYRDLATGRWTLEDARYRAYSAQLHNWATAAGEALALAEIDAVKARREALTEAVHGFARGTRSFDYLVLQANNGAATPPRPTLLLARDWFADHLQATVLADSAAAGFVAAVRVEKDDGPVAGRQRPPVEGDWVRSLPVTAGGLVWNVEVWPDDPGAVTRAVRQRQRTYLMLIIGLVLLLGFGTYLTSRVVRREMEVAQMKSDFVAAVSHEFRSPVTGIRQLAEMLMRGRVPTEARRQEYYERITYESDRLARTLENLLDFSRMEEGRRPYRFESTDTREWLATTVTSFLARSGRASHRIVADMADGLPAVRVDREALGNAVENLLDNAVKYSPGAEAVWLHATSDGAAVTIQVRDEGVGITTADQAHVFDRFYRAAQEGPERVPGTGLGLSLVRHIVDAHGGRVSLESQIGVGTTVSIHLKAEH